MSQRYLFGPVTPEFADQNLHEARRRGDCVAFGPEPGVDVSFGDKDSWEAIPGRLPDGWRPDFVALYLPYTSVAPCLWQAPLPVVGLAADWNLLWHQYRHQLPLCDLVLTDTRGVEALGKEGIRHARPANLFGLGRSFVESQWPDGLRDIDVLFVGNLQPAVQRERLPWLGRLSHLSERWNVQIRSGVFGEPYRELLSRSRIVFNRSIRGECNKRVFEAAAAGALLFQEADNREVSAYFRDRVECVFYEDRNLEELLERYLESEDERRAIATAAQERVREFSFERFWSEQVAMVESELPALSERVRQRYERRGERTMASRVWQAMSSAGADPELAGDIAKALVDSPGSAALHNALGVVTARQAQGTGPLTDLVAKQAVGYFRRAAGCDPNDVMARLNLAEALLGAGETQAAVDEARQAVRLIDRGVDMAGLCRDVVHFPTAYDVFRVEWEAAAWRNAGDSKGEAEAKARLVRWRLHGILAEVTGDLPHYYESALARADVPPTRASLGCALARAGRLAEAAPHLRCALTENPFDLPAARALFQVLEDSGDHDGQRRLAQERRLLAQAAPQAAPLEDWAARTPPAADGLVSIVVLCCNELGFTRLCLESVLRHTRKPYELVLVDNGSMDRTPAYLEDFRKRTGPERVVVIRNEDNRGFAGGCNQALARARGSCVVLLNNDVVVTPGWLDGLVAWSLHDWPRIGLVGPVTNYAPPPQLAEPGYRDLMGLDASALKWRREHAGKVVWVERLTGFCLLVRREVLRAVGGFDERFGRGFFEDDDLCFRARDAGFRMLAARDVYVHHFGSRTFQALGIDAQAELQRNFEAFRSKWGEERTKGYRLPQVTAAIPDELAGQALSQDEPPAEQCNGQPDVEASDEIVRALADVAGDGQPRAGRMRVSLCMIVKNEEANLPGCLLSAADLFDEVVVVDTGSTDQTKAVATQYGAKVVDSPWVDSFAAARNASLEHATADYAFWLDADDRLDEISRTKLRALFASLKDENAAYVLKCRCLPDPESGTATIVDHVRLFRNRADVRWKYRVHEQILPALRASGADVRSADVVIEHTGYQDSSLRAAKRERYLRLLRLNEQEEPDEPFVLFNLGWTLSDAGRPEEALPLLRRSLERSDPSATIVRKLFALIVECHRRLGQKEEALSACRAGRRHYPDDEQLLHAEATLLMESGQLDEAEARLLALIGGRESPQFSSVAEGLRGHSARHNLGVLYRRQHRDAEAEAQWQAALAERPDHLPTSLALGELYADQRRADDLDRVLDRLGNDGQAAWAAAATAVLRVRSHLIRRELAPARQAAEDALARHPKEAALWEAYSHALLQDGGDLTTAEKALRTVLELEPDNAQARHNLGVLMRQVGRPGALSPEVAAPGGGL